MNPDQIKQQVVFDRELIERYNQSGPRYTSYPTAPHLHEGFTVQDFRAEALQAAAQQADRPLSLYIHIPFCDTVCYYCACNKIVTPDRSRAARYLQSLLREVALLGELFGRQRPVLQLHLGGGTPTYLESAQLQQLMEALQHHFCLVPDTEGEYGIEIDPREMPSGSITQLRRLGFNRLSIGVQDLDPAVQKAVNRIQPLELNRRVVEEARAAGFPSINLDLIYGLPLQSEQSFLHTLQHVVEELDPDRLAVFNYAHLPQYFMPQRRVNPEQLPSPAEKLRILESTIRFLTAAGYLYVGMDHFAKPNDELAVAQRQGVLHRNFQGYTTHGDCDLIGMGSSSISQIGRIYAQNEKEVEPYYQRIDQGELAIFRGLSLHEDDLLRREVIMRLICDFQLDRQAIAEKFHVDFADYFQAEMDTLQRMIGDGLLEEEGPLLRVKPAGRLLIRNICMVFDWYLNHAQQKKSFSRTI
ncbi:MAG: oxygen-independent coproporphyrinogen III oxidase [Magnetococcales bacterium]|nr:oxygen-independent coproporphyrinogen III oxidase [Magnetococcales bacterium]MBF0115450.1 oxygen-independent coproporphyrinogen III oxidase [Magnetococcales bacterium]